MVTLSQLAGSEFLYAWVTLEPQGSLRWKGVVIERHDGVPGAYARPPTRSSSAPRSRCHVDDLLAGLDVQFGDEVLDRVDQIVPPGTDVGVLDRVCTPPALQTAGLRRRPAGDRAAA